MKPRQAALTQAPAAGETDSWHLDLDQMYLNRIRMDTNVAHYIQCIHPVYLFRSVHKYKLFVMNINTLLFKFTNSHKCARTCTHR